MNAGVGSKMQPITKGLYMWGNSDVGVRELYNSWAIARKTISNSIQSILIYTATVSIKGINEIVN